MNAVIQIDGTQSPVRRRGGALRRVRPGAAVAGRIGFADARPDFDDATAGDDTAVHQHLPTSLRATSRSADRRTLPAESRTWCRGAPRPFSRTSHESRCARPQDWGSFTNRCSTCVSRPQIVLRLNCVAQVRREPPASDRERGESEGGPVGATSREAGDCAVCRFRQAVDQCVDRAFREDRVSETRRRVDFAVLSPVAARARRPASATFRSSRCL